MLLAGTSALSLAKGTIPENWAGGAVYTTVKVPRARRDGTVWSRAEDARGDGKGSANSVRTKQ
jgi:hypothetical protein